MSQRGAVFEEFAEDEAACGGLQCTGHDEGYILADHLRCVFSHDHGAIIEVADCLALLFAAFDEFDGELLTGDDGWFEGICKIIDVQNGDVLNLGDAVEAQVRCDDSCGHALGEFDEHLVDGLAGDRRFVDRDIELACSLEPADQVQASPASGAFEFVT